MDNISRRHSNEDTTNSMYLSFDAESTMSTACYKTLEAMSDISAIDMNDSVNQNKSGNNEMNTTLEVHDNSQNVSPLKTVRKVEFQDVKLNTPFKAHPKNILKEYKALCSTPAREQLLKTVDVKRGSDATRCVDLGLAFLGVDDEKPAFFPLPNLGLLEENKENLLPDAEEVSTLSTCSSVEITTSVIEKKMSSMSNVGSIIVEESVEDMKIVTNAISVDIADKVSKINSGLDNALQTEETENIIRFNKENLKTTPKAKIENNKYMGIINQSLAIEEKKDYLKEDGTSVGMSDEILKINSILNDVNNAIKTEEKTANISKYNKENLETSPKAVGTFKNLEIQEEKISLPNDLENERKRTNKNSSKPKIAVLAANARRSVCEPNLKMNKPSRILNSDKRKSLLPTCKKSTSNMDAEIEIPMLMNKMLKITNTPLETEKNNILKDKEFLKDCTAADKRRSIMSSMKTRTSLIPPAPGAKKPFKFNQRMSVVVKTTLNSPARKIARKISISGATSLPRKSTIPQKTTTTDNSKVNKAEILSRKSMAPKTIDTNRNFHSDIKTLVSLQETSSNPIHTAQRKSLYPLANNYEKGMMVNTNSNLWQNKAVISYTCNVCKEKFRIKSLLDAHKRSHESDSKPPAFIKKPSGLTQPVAGTMLGNCNKCKYCDKKFALLKALHIHLLQNCSKIPPSEKRKLQYTDLNHVEKAQLPNVFPHNSLQNSVSSSVSSANDAPRYASKQNIVKSSSESLNENKDIQKTTSNLLTSVNGNNVITSQTTAQKAKKITAHAGVYRTPSKSVPCHLCKLTFKSILDYTNHNLTTHSSFKPTTDDTDKAVKQNITSKHA